MPEKFFLKPESNPRETVPPEVIERWNDRNYPLEHHGESYSVIILGETHHDDDAEKKQVELIRLVRPEFVLHEFLKGWLYNPKTNEFEKQKMRRFNSNDIENPWGIKPDKIIMDAARDMGFSVVGCDITDAEFDVATKKIARQHPETYSYDNYGLVKKNDPEFELLPGSDEIMPFRDGQMVETTLHYLGETSKPLVVIIGSDHGKNIHNQKLLQRKNFGYAFVNQSPIIKK